MVVNKYALKKIDNISGISDYDFLIPVWLDRAKESYSEILKLESHNLYAFSQVETE